MPSASPASGPLTAKPSFWLSARSRSWCSTVSAVMEPFQVLLTGLVMMLITPPMASAPYSEDMGPRTTSTRSMSSSGTQPLS